MGEALHRLGPIYLAPGINRLNAGTFMLVAFVTIGFLTFVNFGQAYVLNEILLIPRETQGNLTGRLAFLTEVVTIVLVGGFGVLSDRIGRRPILVSSLLFMAVAYVLYPLATNVTELFVYRFIYAIGVAAGTVMMAILANDYPLERSRGKMIALGGVFNGLGVIVVNGAFGPLPEWLVAQGFDSVTAGRYTFWLVAALLVPAAICYRVGLRGGTPVHKAQRPKVTALLQSGFREARNPRIMLAYLTALVARSDLVVVGTFTILWGTLAGLEQGMTTASASKQAVFLLLIAQSAGLLWTFVVGPVLDRVNRVTGMVMGTGIAAAAFLSVGFVDDPLDPSGYPYFVLVGIGQVSCLLASMALVGQEAPIAKRGSVIGMSALFGAVGILISTIVGGRLFDSWTPAAPFILVGAANAVIFVIAIAVRIFAPGPMPAEISARA